MFDIVCLVSGGGTNLAAIIKAIDKGEIKYQGKVGYLK